MRRSYISILIAVLVCFASAAPGWAEEHEADAMRIEVCKQVDALLLKEISESEIEPVAISSDAEFLRRVYLDLAGQVPSVSAARDFLDSDEPDKRSQLIEDLLSNRKTFDHMAEVWRNAMLPSNASPQLLQNSSGLHTWLRKKFTDNLRYDRIVSDIVAATGTDQDGPALFFTALELEPKKIASATARIFLGLQLDCAECHDHPFDDWKQVEFWATRHSLRGYRSPTA